MFLRFKKDCHDRMTQKDYTAGDIKEFPDKRAEEILAVQDGMYAEEVNVTPVGSKKGPRKTEPEKQVTKAETADEAAGEK